MITSRSSSITVIILAAAWNERLYVIIFTVSSLSLTPETESLPFWISVIRACDVLYLPLEQFKLVRKYVGKDGKYIISMSLRQ